MRFTELEIQLIKDNLNSLLEIYWTFRNDEKLNELFFGISDIFEKKLKWSKKIRDWR